MMNPGTLSDAVHGLRARFGDGWSFDIVEHKRNGGGVEVEPETRTIYPSHQL